MHRSGWCSILEKTKLGDPRTGAAFGCLGFDLRRVRTRRGNGHSMLITPKKTACKAVKAKGRDLIRRGGAPPAKGMGAQSNTVLAGWVNSCRVGHASRAVSEVRNTVEMSAVVGGRRWRNEYLDGVLGLFWDWKSQPLPSTAAFS